MSDRQLSTDASLVQSFLQDLGHGEVEIDAKTGLLRSVDAVVLVGGRRRVGARSLQRLHGVADVEGRTALAFSSAGFTDEAVEWARHAHMPLFTLSSGMVNGVNTVATQVQQTGLGSSMLSTLRDSLAAVDQVGRPLSIIAPAKMDGQRVSVDLHFGVNTCHDCGDQPADGRARACGLCGSRLPTRRFPWRVKIQAPTHLVGRFVESESRFPYLLDSSIGDTTQVLAVHRDHPSAFFCWMDAATRLGLNLREVPLFYLGHAIDAGVESDLRTLGLRRSR